MIGYNKPYIRFLFVNLYLLVCAAQIVQGGYIIPEVKFEAFRPSGLRVSIPNEPGLRLFAFHAKTNDNLKETEPGELSGEVKKATGNFWVYYDPKVELHVGDYLSYWVFVQNEYLGFRKVNLTWAVKELVDQSSQSSLECQNSVTTYNSKVVCKKKLLIHDSFDAFDDKNWLKENYIPFNRPNYEFNYYSPDCVKVEDSKLKITPVPKQAESEFRGTLNLGPQCTSSSTMECVQTSYGPFLLPPVKSGMIRSLFSFKYGRVDVAATLPCGDWIFPVITLNPKNSKNPASIYIAYSRGNKQLRGSDGLDIGGKLLFSGPCLNSTEPKRSEFLKSKMHNEPYCMQEHIYSLKWTPNDLTSYVDDVEYGKVDTLNEFNNHFLDGEFYLSLGVSVGGINDFPNNFVSGGYSKPWVNSAVKQVKDFAQARNDWLPTWSKASALIVNSIRVYAL